MIYGIGTDIVAVKRLIALWRRHGALAAGKILTKDEQTDFFALFPRVPVSESGAAEEEKLARRENEKAGRFLARRWAAKEAFAKALGTGILTPASLSNIGVAHNAAGAPTFAFAPELAGKLAQMGISASFLSLSDEREYAVAFAVLESRQR
ncbi:MAG: holo-ACP synthase [Zoogloeaceae bacterium]|jgi:holo-[acyl-carrier protein] synthase|nr:holo-ACP synthase [Zoogloeaceae bacterium]